MILGDAPTAARPSGHLLGDPQGTEVVHDEGLTLAAWMLASRGGTQADRA